jgi:integrase
MGLDPDLLSDAYETLREAQQVAASADDHRYKVSRVTTKKNYLDKQLVYDDEQAWIYRRGDTKAKTWYLRIFDDKSKKPFVKSLQTQDHARALTKARTIYQEVKGKIDRGERLHSITSSELVEKYINSLHITDIPHEGVTPDSLKNKKYYLRIWLEFIDHLGHKNTSIDRLPQDKLRDFGKWFQVKPREDRRVKARSHEQINNAISTVRLCYYRIAVRDRYVSGDKVPDIDRLKQQRDERYKRDVLELEQYERLWKFLEYKYTREKDLTEIERRTRILFTKFVGIMVNTGLRPKEFLTLRWCDISNYNSGDPKIDSKVVVLHIRAEVSKTGRQRNVVAPVKPRLEIIKRSLREIGCELKPDDYVLINPQKKDGSAYSRMMFHERLKKVLELSGLAEELKLTEKKISLYSFRHQYICWRLRYGGVPIHLIAKNCGTSIQKIEQTYGHIETEKQVDVITKNQGISRKADVELTTLVGDENL